MKILFLVVGDEMVASTRVRVLGHIPFLTKNGYRCKVLSYTSKAKCGRILNLENDNAFQAAVEIFHKLRTITSLLFLAPRYDVIFIQKVALPPAVWRFLNSINQNIIFDFDDALYLDKDIRYILKGAKCVVVSNEHLKEIVSRYKGIVYELISPIEPVGRHGVVRGKGVMLGWLGSPGTSAYLHKLIPVFKRLKEEFRNLKIEFMGARDDAAFGPIGITVRKWSPADEKKFLETLDIGIMPLDDDEGCRAKGGYKLLLYMSNGIPCVASPIGVNKVFVSEGINGFLPLTHDEWLERLSLLIRDVSLRQKMGEEGLRIAERLYSYEVVTPKLMSILNSIKKEEKWRLP